MTILTLLEQLRAILTIPPHMGPPRMLSQLRVTVSTTNMDTTINTDMTVSTDTIVNTADKDIANLIHSTKLRMSANPLFNGPWVLVVLPHAGERSRPGIVDIVHVDVRREIFAMR